MTGIYRFPASAVCAAGFLVIASAPGARAQAPVPDSAAAISYLRATCGDEPARAGLGLLRGEVRDADDHPVGSAAVTIGWRRAAENASASDRTPATTDRPVLGVFTDSTGHWQVCGAPLRTRLSIRVAADEGSDERISTLDDGHPVASVELALHERAAGRALPPPASALVVYSVHDREGSALGGVTLELEPATGPARRVVTDSAGRAIVPAVDPGRARMTSLAIGYRPGELFVPLEAGRNTVPLILDAVRIPTLATVRVIGGRPVLARHQEFEMRRASHQATASITAEDIAKRNPVDTWQMLTNVPAMRVIQYGAGVSGVFAMSTREQPVIQRLGPVGGATSSACWFRLMLDGVVLPDAMPDLSTLLPEPSAVHGIEVFAGLATIPPQYARAVPDGGGSVKSNACGLIAVWTK